MSAEIQAALITAAGTVLASAIAVIGITAISKLRSNLQILSRQVEGYYHLETYLISEILSQEGSEASDDIVRKKRGVLRTAAAGESGMRPDMSALDAQKLRRRFFLS